MQKSTASTEQYRDNERRWADGMASAVQGDQEAYAALLTELGVVIEGYLVRRFGPVHFVEDCVQESLVALHAARHTYDPVRPFSPWLFAIVRNKTIDWMRHTQRFESARVALAEALDVVNPGMEQSDGSVSGCFARLDAPHRQALTLTKIYGYTMAEAASRAGISTTAMKVRVHRALKKLRIQLREIDEDFS